MTAQQKPIEIYTETTRLTLSWETFDDNTACLKFNTTAWALFANAAKDRGADPEEMISVALAKLLGKIIDYRPRT